MRKLLLLALWGLMSVGVHAQRVIDRLDRALVAIPQGDKDGQDNRYGVDGTGIFLSWRILPTEYYDTQYNLYRNGTRLNSKPLAVSNYQDNGGTRESTYKVVPVVRGEERPDLASAEVKPWAHQYFDIPVLPVVNRNGQQLSGYTLNDASVGDVDGDLEMEFVVKRRNDSGNLLSASNRTDFNLYECYKMDGTRLWWIDMGPNLMSGADEQFDLILYDWDMDGRAEAVMRGADNMIIHTRTGHDIRIGNMNYYAPRDEYTKEGAEYLLYLDGATGEPYGWNGTSDAYTPMAYPLPRFEQGESDYATVWGKADTGHRATKHYFGAPYLDGRKPSIFLGRGCYTRHKFCAYDVDPVTHQLTQLWRWNCYDGGSPWFGNGFHNFAIADIDMDGRDEIVFGSMMIDDTGYGLATTGYGHGDAQHCGDLDPYRWGLEQFVCLESGAAPGVAYTNAMTQQVYYQNGTGGDNGRCMAGNFQNFYPGGVGRSAQGGLISLTADRVIEGASQMAGDDYWNMRIYWDGDLLDEFMDSPGVERAPCVYKYPGQTEVGTGRAAYANDRVFLGGGTLNNSSKNNPCFLGDIMGDWREEIVVRCGEALRIYISSYPSPWGLTTLWADHVYRNGMTWQPVGYNQPPHTSFFVGELEGITQCPPALTTEGRTELADGATITTTDDHLLVSGYKDQTFSVADGASPWVLTVNTPAWVKGSGSRQADSSTPKQPARSIDSYTTTLTGGAFSGSTRIVKQGEGTLVLPAVVEKHTGETNVWQGTLAFDGTLESSPLWLNRHTTLLSDGGRFMGGIKADYNATICPGGSGHVGTLTTTTLQLGFGARVVLDFDGTAFDQLNATTLSLENKTWSYGPKYKAPVLELHIDGTLEAGTYVLGAVGSIAGKLAEMLIEGLDNTVKATLQHTDGQLLLVVETMRQPGTVVWNGSTGNNTWIQAQSINFLYNGEADYAAAGDDIIFDDQAASTAVVIKGAVSPRSVTFNNETKAYTLSGDSIVGGGTITKNGAARVTINNLNHTGTTHVNKGMLSVNMLANTKGQDYGALGDARQTINMADGTTLQTNGAIITDQQLNLTGEVTVDVPSGKSVIFNQGIRGAGATLVKDGAGAMETGTSGNTYARLVVKDGTMTSNFASNGVEQLPPTVELRGGTLWCANLEGGNGVTCNADFVVEKGQTGTIYCGFRSVYNGRLTGEGTVNIYTGGVRCYYDGDWSQFSGTINAGKNNRQNKKSYDPVWSLRNAKGLPNATLNVMADVYVNNEGKDISLGRVTGQGTLTGSGRWILGENNSDFIMNTEIGVTSERTNPYGGTIGVSTSPFVKRGTGRMTITQVGRLNGAMTIAGGTLCFNNSSLATLINGSNAATVQNGARIVGQGCLYTLTLQKGALLMPCGSIANETTPGTIKTQGLLNAMEGSVVDFLIGSVNRSQLQPATLRMNGTVKVTLLSGYTPRAGHAFTLWTTGSFSGTPKFDLPELPAGLYWDTSGVADKTGVLRITDDASQGIGRMGADVPVTCHVYTTGGTLVASFSCQKGEAASAVARQPLRADTYILQMQGPDGTEVEKVVVR